MVKKLHNYSWKFLFSFCFILLFTLHAKAGNPHLILNGADTIIIEQGDTFNDPGAKAYDASNNIIAGANILISQSPKFNTFIPGSYIFKYNYTDTSGNKATEIKRLVIVIPDSTAPVLIIAGQIWDTLAVYNSYTQPQYSAYDNVDGNITANVMVNSNLDITKLGTYTLKYSVADATGNKSETVRYIVVADTSAPTLSIDNPLFDTISLGDIYAIKNLYVADNYDSSVLVKYTGNYLEDFPDGKATMTGSYKYIVNAYDKSGNHKQREIYIWVMDTAYHIVGNLAVANLNTNYNRNATIYLIKYDAADSTLIAIDTFKIITGTGSWFGFYPVSPGDYLIKAALDSTDSLYTDYLPTYYQNSLRWDSAQTIHITADAHISVEMIAGTNLGGPGFISGKVSQGANKKEGDPLENIQITLTTANDKPVAYTYSDKNGYFEFKNLAIGTYKLFGEIEGKKAISGEITITETQQSRTDITVVVNSTEVKTSTDEIIETTIAPANFPDHTRIYPNPANNTIYIYSKNGAAGNITLYNAVGQPVLSEKITDGFISLDVQHITPGIYFLQLHYPNNRIENKRIVILH